MTTSCTGLRTPNLPSGWWACTQQCAGFVVLHCDSTLMATLMVQKTFTYLRMCFRGGGLDIFSSVRFAFLCPNPQRFDFSPDKNGCTLVCGSIRVMKSHTQSPYAGTLFHYFWPAMCCCQWHTSSPIFGLFSNQYCSVPGLTICRTCILSRTLALSLRACDEALMPRCSRLTDPAIEALRM